jgi:hypothetical protein
MPALVCLGLRWRTGSDDFVMCGIVFAIISFVVGIIGIAFATSSTSGLVIDSANVNHTVTVHPCEAIVPINDTTTITPSPTELIGGLEADFSTLVQVQCFIFIGVAVAYAFLAMVSSIGTIMEPRRREPAVPIALIITSIGSIGLLVIGCIIAKRIHVDDQLSMCTILQNVGGFHSRPMYYIAHALAAIGITEFTILFLYLFMAIDGTRSKEVSDRDSYHALWLFRMKLMCFCFGWRSAEKNNDTTISSNKNSASRAGGVLNGPAHRGAAVSGFDAFTDAADALAVVFEGLDLVPSDIAAGLLLLQGIQERRHRQEVAGTVCYKSSRNMGGLALHRMKGGVFAEPPLSSREPNSPTLPSTTTGNNTVSNGKLIPACGAFDRVSRQAQPFSEITPTLLADLKLIERYSNYFLGAYGWKLYIFGRLASGLPKLCANKPCFCCSGESRPGRATDCCGCDGNAMLKYTGLNEDEVLLTSFKNEVFLPAFYVALEHIHSASESAARDVSKLRETSRKVAQTSSAVRGGSSNTGTSTATGEQDFTPSMCVSDDDDRAVIIAIRGSMSLEDCVTDANAVPAPLEAVGEGYGGPLPAYCHGGMLRCAERILIELEINGILGHLVGATFQPTGNCNPDPSSRGVDMGRLSERKIVVLGHSLGAGTAVILSILLRQRYPSLIPRLQCIAYAPPGGLLTAELAEYTKSFVVGTFMGCDVIPRLAVHTLTELRSSMLHALAASKQGKTAVLCQFLCPTRTETFDDEREMSPHAVSVHSKLLSQGQAQRRNDSPVGGSVSVEAGSTALHPADFLLAHKLYPPAKLVHFVKAVSVSYSFGGGACVCDGAGSVLCGSCCCPKEDTYYPIYITPNDTQEIICSPYMGLDHLPDRFYDTMHDCFIRMRQHRLDELVSTNRPLSTTNNSGELQVSSPSSVSSPAAAQPVIFRHQALTRVEGGIVNRDNLFDVVRRAPATPTMNVL